MFKKSSKRNLRQRNDSNNEENTMGPSEEEPVINIAALKAQRERKHKNKGKSVISDTLPRSQKSVLSFADDEEDEITFKAKKSSRSSRIARQIKRLNQEEKKQGEAPNGGYTAQDLEELKKLSMKPGDVGTRQANSTFEAIPSEDSAQSKYSGIEISSWIRPGDIPDANRIHAARKQREMMRKYGSDYIPIETKNYTRDTDDLDGSGSDEGPTMEMKGIIDDCERVANQIGSNGEGELHRDEEFDRWEAEMIKKGISTQQPASAVSSNDQLQKNPSFPDTFNQNTNYSTEKNVTNTASSSHAGTVAPQEALAQMKLRLTQRLSALKEVHSTHQQDFNRATLDVEESEETAGNLGNLTSLSSQYTYFQDMRAYIADLIDCLTEKNSEIEAIESTWFRIWKKRAQCIITRRQRDVEDESSDISALISGSKSAMLAPNNEKMARIREREARRSYRRMMRQQASTPAPHFDGQSTDDEESSMEKAEQHMEIQQINAVKSRLFEDVLEEFYNVQLILSKFQDWREKHPKSYNDAYIDLCVSKCLAPFVKLATLEWNPLEENCPQIERMVWFKDLLFFGTKKKDTEYKAVYGNPENKILSSLVDKIFLGKITCFVKEVWDPLSKRQSKRLSSLLCSIADTYPCMRSDSRRCSEFLLAICTRIEQAIDGDAFIPLYPSNALTSMPNAMIFFERRSWTCVKLFENILAFSNIISQTALIELAFTSLLNRYIMLSLQTSPITEASVYKCQCIANAIPLSWLRDSDSMRTHFEPFSRYSLHSATHIHGQLASCNDVGKQRAKYCIAQLGKILLRLGFNEMSETVAELLV